MRYYDELKKEIITKLRKEGYTNEFIDYPTFKILYEPYKAQISEKQFANILGVRDKNYSYFKTSYEKNSSEKNSEKNSEEKKKKARVRILKNEVVSEDMKQKIVTSLKELGYTNRRIHYVEFQSLYEQYKGEMSEEQFGIILGVSADYRNRAKNRGTTMLILEEKVEELRKQEIIEELREKGFEDKWVYYAEFQSLYEPYKEEMDELQFVALLGIKKKSYQHAKYDKTKLHIQMTDKDRRQEIIRELKQQGYTNQSIYYKKFQNLYEQYKEEMSELQFASILGATETEYERAKNKGTRMEILRDEDEIKLKQKQIVDKLKKEGYEDKEIYYVEFQSLYEQYKEEMSELQFATLIGVKKKSYEDAKYANNRIKVLPLKQIEEQREKEIIDELKKQGYKNQLISYAQFQSLYETYKKEMSELQFATIVGIKDGNYEYASREKGSTRIHLDGNIDIVKYLLQDARFYTKQELQEVSEKAQMDVEDLLLFIARYNLDIVQQYRNILEQKDRLYIGRTLIDKDFLEKHAKDLVKHCRSKSWALGKKYRRADLADDIASETLIKLIQTRGDIVYNYENESEALYILYFLCNTIIRHGYYSNFSLRKVKSLYQESNGKGGNKYVPQKFWRDKKQNVEAEAINNYEVDKREKISKISTVDDLYQVCISIIEKCHQLGMNSDESIEEICKRTSIGKKQLLEIMEKYLIEKKKVKQTEKGDYIRGEAR